MKQKDSLKKCVIKRLIKWLEELLGEENYKFNGGS